MKCMFWRRVWLVWCVGFCGFVLAGCLSRKEAVRARPVAKKQGADAAQIRSRASTQKSAVKQPTALPRRQNPPVRRRAIRSIRRTPKRFRRHRPSRYVYVSSNAYRFYLQGRLLAEKNKHKEAIKAFKSALVYHSKSPHLHYCIARQYKRLQKLETAFFWARKMRTLPRKSARAEHLLGQLFAVQKKWKKAASFFQIALKKDPKMVAAYRDLEQVWRLLYNQRIRLMSLLKQQIVNLPESYVGYLRLAQLYERLLQEKLALRYYKESLNRKPSNVVALAQMAGVSFRLRRYSDAIRSYQMLLDYRPGAWQIRILLGATLLLRNGPHDRELANFQFRYVMKEVTQLSEADRALRVGWELHSRGLLRDSELWLKKALQFNPKHVQAKLAMGLLRKSQGQIKLSMRWFQGVPKKPLSSYVEAQSRVLDALLMSKKIKKARALYYKARGEVKKEEHLIRLSQSFVERAPRSDLWKEARYLRKLRKRSAKPKDLSFHLAYTLFKLRRFKQAGRILRGLLAQKKNNSAALNFLGYVYAVRGIRLGAAERYIRWALTLEPGNAYYLDSLGWVMYLRGNMRVAHHLLTQAHHLLPNEAVVMYHLARVEEQKGNRKKALRLYQRSLVLSPPSDVVRKLQYRLKKLKRKR